MSSKTFVVAGAASALLSACATVSSTPRTDTQNLAVGDAGGVTYFLPTRLVKLTATREPVDMDELTEARGAAAVDL